MKKIIFFILQLLCIDKTIDQVVEKKFIQFDKEESAKLNLYNKNITKEIKEIKRIIDVNYSNTNNDINNLKTKQKNQDELIKELECKLKLGG